MPELPEVETVVRTLAAHVIGRRIAGVEVRSRRVVPKPVGRAAGREILRVGRSGKHILLILVDGILEIHLGMTGAVLVDADSGPHTRAVIRLDRGVLIYNDPRMFGRIRWRREPPGNLGPDALSVGLEEFVRLLRGRRARIKTLLLNQGFLAGLGNIYADESLFRARIHPRAMANRVSRRRAAQLHASIHEVLREAIALGGSSVSDYVDADGRGGSFQQFHRVYGREGEPCTCCGASVKRIVMAQRGTHYCPRCQRA